MDGIISYWFWPCDQATLGITKIGDIQMGKNKNSWKWNVFQKGDGYSWVIFLLVGEIVVTDQNKNFTIFYLILLIKKNIDEKPLFGTLLVFIAVKRTRPFSTCTKLKKLFEVLKFHSRTSILF